MPVMPRLLLGSLLSLLLSFPGNVTAARPLTPLTENGTNVAFSPADPMDPRELAAFLDPIVARQMADQKIPGAVFILVKDGYTFLARGYGSRDLASGAPIDPDRTLFHIDSLSKPVTATSILQLADRGQVRLNQDVNTYLTRFHLPNPYLEPVTLAQLLTHTAGLDYDLDDVGVDSLSPLALRRWDDQLVRHPPAPVLPPGQEYLYSNTAYALLGEVVAQVSGRPFDQYVTENIFSPLGMGRSSFLQPSPFVGDLVITYEEVGGSLRAVADEYLDDGPARAMTTTATDLAKFMIAELSDGQYGSAPILSASAVLDQNRQHFTFDPNLPGMTYAFQEWPTNGQRVLGHHGTDPGRHSTMVLLPDQHLGFFLASTRAGYDLFTHVFRGFMDHYYPPPAAATPAPPGDSADQTARLAGTYRSTAYSHRTVSKLLLLVSEPAEVQVTGPRSLMISLPGSAPLAAHAVGPLLFRLEDTQTRVAFQANSAGDVTKMVYYGLSAYEKVPWFETAPVQQALFGLFFLTFLLATIRLTIGSWLDRRTAHPVRNAAWGHMASALSDTVGGLNAGWLVMLFVVLLERDRLDLSRGLPVLLSVALGVPVVTSALAPVLAAIAARRWHRRDLSLIERTSYTLFALVALAFVPFLWSWNLLGING